MNNPAASFYSLGLIGYPLRQSMSPLLHAAALRETGLNGEYRLYPIAPGVDFEAELDGLFNRARSGEIHGFNVTIPHKTAVRAHLDGETPAARSIGAVNTIIARDGRLIGDNTDAPGFLTDLLGVFPGLGRSPVGELQTALVMGAGGAARAVIFALADAGWRVIVAARKREQAAALARELIVVRSDFAVEAEELSVERLRPHLSDLLLVVNATPAGMIPDVDAEPWPTALPLPEGAFYYDLIYKPFETAWIHRVRERRLPAANGMGMLIEQAALAFERWTGLPAPRRMMRAAAEAAAGGSLDPGLKER